MSDDFYFAFSSGWIQRYVAYRPFGYWRIFPTGFGVDGMMKYSRIKEKPVPDVPALQDMVTVEMRQGYFETRTENDTPQHYQMAIEPIEYILRNELDFAEGCVVKYISRWRDKGGILDLEKARSYIELLIREAKDNPERYGL